jgi:hypothetical protein
MKLLSAMFLLLLLLAVGQSTAVDSAEHHMRGELANSDDDTAPTLAANVPIVANDTNDINVAVPAQPLIPTIVPAATAEGAVQPTTPSTITSADAQMQQDIEHANHSDANYLWYLWEGYDAEGTITDRQLDPNSFKLGTPEAQGIGNQLSEWAQEPGDRPGTGYR